MSLEVLADVRPNERRRVSAALLTLLGFMAGHALLETARDALFLGNLSARHLPWVYLGIAFAALLATRVQEGLPPRSFGDELRGWMLLSGLGTLSLWLLLVTRAGPWVFYALYAWTGILSTLVVVRFWTVLGSAFTVVEAKRLFPIVGSGAVAGAIAGSALARLLAEVTPPRHLVVAGALTFFGAALVSWRLGGSVQTPVRAPQPQSRDVARVLRLIWTRPYLRRVATLILLATLTFTLVDYLFKSSVDERLAAGEMDEFFASVYLALNVLAVLVQVAFVPWIVRRVGAVSAHVIVPIALLLGSASVAVFGGLLTALVLKGADGALRHTLHRTTAELLFVPVTGELRARVKAFIDVVGQRGGQVLGSLVILALLAQASSNRMIAVAAAAACLAWVWLAVGLRDHYLDVFRDTLRRDVTRTRVEFPALDVASLETLLRMLSDTDDRRVLAALDVLAEQRKIDLVPTLILFHPSSAVALRAFGLFSAHGRRDHLPVAQRLESHPDPLIRSASLRVRAQTQPDATRWRAALADPSPLVRATALVGLVVQAGLADSGVSAEIGRIVEGNSVEAKLALAQAIAAQPHAAFSGPLLGLSRLDDDRVALAVIQAMGAAPDPAYVDRLIDLLSRRGVREEAAGALLAHGEPALASLSTALADPSRPEEVRRHVPRAIGAFKSGTAATRLIAALASERDGLIHFNILSALGRLRAEDATLPLDRDVLQNALEETLRDASALMQSRRVLEGRGSPPGAGRDLLIALLRHRERHALERVFRMLNLQVPSDDLYNAWRGLESGTPERRANSRELVEGLLEPPWLERVLSLIDDLYETGSAPPVVSPAKVRDVLQELLRSDSVSLSALAAYHAREANLVSLVPDLEQRRKTATPLLEAVISKAVEALQESGRPARQP